MSQTEGLGDWCISLLNFLGTNVVLTLTKNLTINIKSLKTPLQLYMFVFVIVQILADHLIVKIKKQT